VNKEIGKFRLLGWNQWEPKGELQHRVINLFPYLRIWYGRGKKVHYFIGLSIFYITYGWLYWNGQFTLRHQGRRR